MRVALRRVALLRILSIAVLVSMLGCGISLEESNKHEWAKFMAQARPHILQHPQSPEEDLLGWRAFQEQRAKITAERLAGQPKVSAAFVDLPIRDALLELSIQSKISVVVDQTVAGAVTMNLKDVPFETALRLVAFSGNYAYSTDGSNYFVGTVDPTSPTYATLTSTRVVPTHMPPKKIAASLNKAYTDYLSFSEGSNFLVLTGPTSILDRLESDIQLVDRPPVQVLIEVLIVETKFGAELDLGLEWNRLATTLEQNLGTDNNPSTFNLNRLDVMGQLSLAFNMLEEKNSASVRSNPKVVTSNGVPAQISSLVESYVVIQTSGLAVVGADLEIIKSGTILKVTPLVTRNDEIELVLEPEVADVIGISEDRSSGSLPVISRRSVKSTIRVKNGDVVILGGLYEEQSRLIKAGLPFLKDVPVVGLFSSRQHDIGSVSELLVFVSPKVIRQ